LLGSWQEANERKRVENPCYKWRAVRLWTTIEDRTLPM